ncbi:prepilin-type N-terminal cleavage/methylation domain-containing protein [candidate division KSB1 bacterium]|nr:prepilin-type N-terminal cleavage/methylation domain-containing protein [candidate division KSB1 bacterium]
MKYLGSKGFTFIEALLSVVLASIVMAGLMIPMLAFVEHLDRSWSVRLMNQYGNDFLEQIVRDLRDARDVNITSRDGFSALTAWVRDARGHLREISYRAKRDKGILRNGEPLDKTFPPSRRQLKEGESFEVQDLQFQLSSRLHDPDLLNNAVVLVTLRLRYSREDPDNPGNEFQKEQTFRTTIYLRNQYLGSEEEETP